MHFVNRPHSEHPSAILFTVLAFLLFSTNLVVVCVHTRYEK